MRTVLSRRNVSMSTSEYRTDICGCVSVTAGICEGDNLSRLLQRQFMALTKALPPDSPFGRNIRRGSRVPGFER